MEQNQNPNAPEAATDEPASHFNPRDSHFSPPPGEGEAPPREKVTVPSPAGLADFEPVPLRYRTDGLTPQKQREYVEALADTGVARVAAARIGVSEQAVNRARRRADARAFDLACEAAQRHGARRLRSIAYERAIEGTVKRHYYHGELKSEEIVYDNRLLIYLLGKAEKLLDPPPETEAVLTDWDPWMDAVERGLPEPEPQPEPEAEALEPDGVDAETDEWDGNEIWEDEDGLWWTAFPPPQGFDGQEEATPGDHGYRRTLSDEEQAVIDKDLAASRGETIGEEAARRDRYFGFAGGIEEDVLFFLREAETNETSDERRGRSAETEG
ncbi:MAG TPA: hypothetical protein VEW25_05315 [Allosphingosinicella sp.]|nr:hypothetical protein [Allosphingosinicella sp.]